MVSHVTIRDISDVLVKVRARSRKNLILKWIFLYEKGMYAIVLLGNPIVVLVLLYVVNNCEEIVWRFCHLFLLFFTICLIDINRRRAGARHRMRGPGEGV